MAKILDITNNLTTGRNRAALDSAREGEARMTDQSPDAELIRLGAEADAIAPQLDAIEAKVGADVDQDPEYRALNERHCELFDLIADMRAQTIEGMRVKARQILWCHSGKLRMPTRDEHEYPERSAFSIVRDLLAGENLK
jgi:hypothetical protein